MFEGLFNWAPKLNVVNAAYYAFKGTFDLGASLELAYARAGITWVAAAHPTHPVSHGPQLSPGCLPLLQTPSYLGLATHALWPTCDPALALQVDLPGTQALGAGVRSGEDGTEFPGVLHVRWRELWQRLHQGELDGLDVLSLIRQLGPSLASCKMAE